MNIQQKCLEDGGGYANSAIILIMIQEKNVLDVIKLKIEKNKRIFRSRKK